MLLSGGEGKRAQGQGLWVSPGLGQGAGVRWGRRGRRSGGCASCGNPEEPEHPGCRKLLANRRGDGAPWPVIPQLDEPPVRPQALGPLGRGGSR